MLNADAEFLSSKHSRLKACDVVRCPVVCELFLLGLSGQSQAVVTPTRLNRRSSCRKAAKNGSRSEKFSHSVIKRTALGQGMQDFHDWNPTGQKRLKVDATAQASTAWPVGEAAAIHQAGKAGTQDFQLRRAWGGRIKMET